MNGKTRRWKAALRPLAASLAALPGLYDQHGGAIVDREERKYPEGQASDYYGNACASFETGTWQVQVKAGDSTTVSVVVFTNTTVADAPGSGPGETGYGLCAGSWSVTVPKSADCVLTVVSAADDGNSQPLGSVVVPGSYGGFDIRLGDYYGEDLTG